jgi:hypothetical protein
VSPPRDEDIPARKKPRLEEPLPTAKALPPPADVDGDDGENIDSVADKQSNPRAIGAIARWTSEEDAELTSPIANTHKTKGGKACNRDWVKIAALVPGRTKTQCCNRWYSALDPSITLMAGRTGTWEEDEDSKLKDAVQSHGDKEWVAVAALIPGRTNTQCCHRWKNALDPSIGRASGREGQWTEDEYSKLKNAVQTLGGKDWGVIAALVPGRTKSQCCSRWHDDNLTAGCTGTWEEDEDSKLKDAVQSHGGKNWFAIAALVPGRTQKQCNNRWRDALNPSIGRASGRKGKWTAVEDSKLKDVVLIHGSKKWDPVAGLVPGRTKSQCWHRWHDILDPDIGRASRLKCKWTPDEDEKLKYSIQTHGGKNWGAIAALVPGRAEKQCHNRWHDVLDPSIALASRRRGKWTAVEDSKLKDAVTR